MNDAMESIKEALLLYVSEKEREKEEKRIQPSFVLMTEIHRDIDTALSELTEEKRLFSGRTLNDNYLTLKTNKNDTKKENQKTVKHL